MIRCFLRQTFAISKKENMKTQIEQNSWGIRSISFWSVLLLALGIIYIGIRFIIYPEVGASGYGIPFENAHDAAYGKIRAALLTAAMFLLSVAAIVCGK